MRITKVLAHIFILFVVGFIGNMMTNPDVTTPAYCISLTVPFFKLLQFF